MSYHYRPGHVTPEGTIIAVDTLNACVLADDELKIINLEDLSAPIGADSRYILDGEKILYNRVGYLQHGRKIGMKLDCILVSDRDTGAEYYVGYDQVCLPL